MSSLTDALIGIINERATGGWGAPGPAYGEPTILPSGQVVPGGPMSVQSPDATTAALNVLGAIYEATNKQAERVPGASRIAKLGQRGHEGLLAWSNRAPQGSDMRKSREAVRRVYDMFAPQDAVGAILAAIPPARFTKHLDDAIRDTRGVGRWFHGSSTPTLLDEGHYGTLNYYGQGLYVTDAADIARGYMKKGRGSDPRFYEVMTKEGPIFDMEAPLPEEVRSHLEQLRRHDDLADLAMSENPKSLREFYDEVRRSSVGEGVSADEVQGLFESVREFMTGKGYIGMQYSGGKLTGKKPHVSRIYFEPQSTTELREIDDLTEFVVGTK